jgi:hypothetical protein
MPTTRTVSTTIVEFTKDEADKIIADHLSALTPSGAQFERDRISFQLNKTAIAGALAAVIPGLPAQFNVQQVSGNPNVALRVTFPTPPAPAT